MRGRIVATLLLGTAMTLTMASVAWAHTTVSPEQASAGSSETFTVSTPGEKEIPIVEEKVEIPQGFEVTSVSSPDGWQGSVEGDSVVWTGGEIGEGEEQEFTFEAQIPDQVGEFAFNAFDTYEDGSVSEWSGPEASVVQVAAPDTQAGESEHGDDHGSHGDDLPETGGLPLSALSALAAGLIAAGAGGLLLKRRLS